MAIDNNVVAAMEAVPTPLAALHSVRNEDGKIIDFEWDYINAAGAKELLVEREEFIGERLLTKLPEHREGLFGLYSQVVETGEPLEISEAGYDDTWGTTEVIPRVYDIRAVKFDDGFIVYWNDVTDRIAARVKLEQQARAGELLELIVSRSPVGLARVAIDGTFTTVNPAFCAITQRLAEDLIGKSFADITHPDDLDADLEQVKRLASHEIDSYVMGKRYLRPDGSNVWVRLHASGVWDEHGEFVTFIAQVADIDEEKRLINQLERSNHDLEHFAYVASHDLKAPLRLANTYTELLAEDLAETELTSRQSEYLNEVTDALSLTRQLVSDLLDFSRATSGAVGMSQVAVGTLIDVALKQLEPDLVGESAMVSIDADAGLSVFGSESLLTRVLVNLLSNAVKYRSVDRPLAIDISAHRIGPHVEIRVADNGNGIPPELQERAFTMFQRLQTKREGTGLGLALVRSIVQRHDGTIAIDSDGATGTTVIVCLPVSGAQFRGRPIRGT